MRDASLLSRVLFVFVFWGLAIGVWYLALKGTERKWFTAGIMAFLTFVTGMLSLIMHRLAGEERWGVLLACLPTLIVAAHAIFIGWFRKKEFEEVTSTPSNVEHLRHARTMIDSERDRYFSSACLGLRYGLPAILLAVIGLVGFFLLYQGELDSLLRKMSLLDEARIHGVVVAARLGIAGAYVYVLTYLGERSFRHDVTSGGAMWCVVTLILGPILAVILHLTWTNGTPAGFSAQALYFAAGLMPRQMSTWIMEAIRRMQLSSGAMIEKPRILPLSNISGITRSIEERLQEEGVEDVYALAMSNPLRIIRNTPFGKRQIADWVDQALMIKHIPDAERRAKFEERGYTGVIDLAHLEHQILKEGLNPSVIDNLEKGTDYPGGALADLIKRLYQDKQVQMVWALYQFDTGSDSRETTEESGEVTDSEGQTSTTP
jgi:hypothetical protein